MRKLIVISLVAVSLAVALSAQSPQSTSPAPQQPSQPAPSAQSQQSQTEITTYTLPPDKYEKAVAYSRAKNRLYFIDFVYSIIILLIILGLRIAPKFRDWAETATRRRFLQAVIFAPLIMIVLDVLSLPPGMYGHWLSRKYEQSVQGWPSWFWDWTKGELINLVVGTLIIWVLFAIIRRSPRRCWFYFWLIALPFIVLAILVVPLVIDPLFNKFEPLAKDQPALVEDIEKVVQRAGMTIPRDRMFLMKASEKVNSVNAYVTGIGASKRVVVWDTTINRMSRPETLFVFSHEMGHYVLNHVWKGIAFSAVLLFVVFYLGYRGVLWALARWGGRWGIRSLGDWAALPALMLVVSILAFFVSPIANGYSRYAEHQADVYGLEVTHGLIPDSRAVATRAFQKLGEINLADPHPSAFTKFWLYSHPPLDERIRFAHEYDPWSKGQSTEFVK